MLEIDVTLEDLADILGEELGLPRIQPKGKEQIDSYKLADMIANFYETNFIKTVYNGKNLNIKRNDILGHFYE